MSKIEQNIILYRHYRTIESIYESMKILIENGWRVHTCLERESDVLVVYEREE